MRSVWRGLTAVGAAALLAAACAGPAELPVIEAADETTAADGEGGVTQDDVEVSSEDDPASGDGAAGTEGDGAGEGEAAADETAAEEAGAAAAEAEPATPSPDPQAVADPCAAHQGRELEPFLDVVAPVDGQVVAGAVDLVGCSNVYEATVNWRLLDEAGAVLDEGFTTADCGTGCVGAFRDTVPLEAAAGAAAVELEVFWISPQDGSDADLVARTLVPG